MRSETYRHVLRLHNNWADRYMAFWHVCMIVLFGGIYVLLKGLGVGPTERTDAYIILAALLVVGAIWQAAGLTLARVHMLLDGIALEAPHQQPPEVITGF
jgi:hypothetical protein